MAGAVGATRVIVGHMSVVASSLDDFTHASRSASPMQAGRISSFSMSLKSSLGLRGASLSFSSITGKNSIGKINRKCKVQKQSLITATIGHTDSFENIFTESELLEGIKREVDAKRLPEIAAPGMQAFYQSYRRAVEQSGVPDPERTAVVVMASVFDRIMVQFEDPFTFPAHHERVMEPFNYYDFGQNYVRPLIDYSTSYLGNRAIFDRIEQQLQEGHNVVLLANHQTEADPAVMALMLESSHPRLATDLTYVAGDRVVLDPFCKPFSMGRNLLCVYSKKRMFDVPELAASKMAANRRTLMEMARLFQKGGMLIWIAPSGGRDRIDPATGEYVPAAFDPPSVEMMRRLTDDASPPGHLYPLALLCYDIMPPPQTMEKDLGEQRIIGYHGVGVSVEPELDFASITSGISERKEAREVFSQAAWKAVSDSYAVLTAAVHGGQGLAAAVPGVTLEQPWKTAVAADGQLQQTQRAEAVIH